MVSIARDRGVDAVTLSIENCGLLDESFDAVLSNFGALNCVEDLESLRQPLARLVRPGGYLAICVIGRFCLWETAWALLRRQPAKAFRRWRNSVMSSLGIRVFYPSKHRLETALRPQFTLVNWRGIGLCVPPSYVTGLSDSLLQKLDALDRRAAHWPVLRGLSRPPSFCFRPELTMTIDAKREVIGSRHKFLEDYRTIRTRRRPRFAGERLLSCASVSGFDRKKLGAMGHSRQELSLF